MKEVKKKEAAPTAKPKVATGKISLFSFFLLFVAFPFRSGRKWPGSAVVVSIYKT